MYGGVVPEIAGRAHLELLTPVIGEALGAGRGGGRRISHAVAATIGPGLIGSLLVGVSEAKALALAWDLPFVGVNHLEGHLFAALLDHPGHRVAGGGAPGLGRPHPARVDGGPGPLPAARPDPRRRGRGGLRQGGSIPRPRVSRRARPSSGPRRRGTRRPSPFPGPCVGDGLDFSFSGLKTAVVHAVRARPDASDQDVAASFQQAVVDVLVAKAAKAAVSVGARGVCLAGGVAANGALRRALTGACAPARPARLSPQPGHLHRQRGHDRRRRLVAARAPGPHRRSTPAPIPTSACPCSAEPSGPGAVRLVRGPVARCPGARYR